MRPAVIWLRAPFRLLGARGPTVVGVCADAPRPVRERVLREGGEDG